MDDKEAYSSPDRGRARLAREAGESRRRTPVSILFGRLRRRPGRTQGIADKTAKNQSGERAGDAYADATTDEARERSRKVVGRAGMQGQVPSGPVQPTDLCHGRRGLRARLRHCLVDSPQAWSFRSHVNFLRGINPSRAERGRGLCPLAGQGIPAFRAPDRNPGEGLVRKPGRSPPRPPPFPLLPPVSPTGRGAAQRCAGTPEGEEEAYARTEIHRHRRQALSLARAFCSVAASRWRRQG